MAELRTTLTRSASLSVPVGSPPATILKRSLTQRRNLKRKFLDTENTIRHSLKAFGMRLAGMSTGEFEQAVCAAVAVGSHHGLRISNVAPKKPSNGVSLTLCGSASISGTDLSRPPSADSFVLCIRCLNGLLDLACGFWRRRGWTAIGPSWRSRRGSAFAQAAVGVQPIGTAGMSAIFKTCRRKERE